MRALYYKGATPTVATSKKQIRANRRNAKKSTGPRTIKGKAISSANALKHGLTAKKHIIINAVTQGENPEEFQTLLADLRDEFKPTNDLQDSLVLKIAHCLWRSNRLINAESTEINSRLDAFAAGNPGDNRPASKPNATEIGLQFLPNSRDAANRQLYEARIDCELFQAITCLRFLRARPLRQKLRGKSGSLCVF